MSKWEVRKRANLLVPGEKFIFTNDLGGEDEVVTVESINEGYGTVVIQAEELDFPIELLDRTMVLME